MPTSNPLIGTQDEDLAYIPAVDPLRRPGAQQVAGATYIPGVASSVTDVMLAQQAQQQQQLQAQQQAQLTQAGPLARGPLATAPEAPAVPEEDLEAVAAGNRGLGALGDMALGLGSGVARLVQTVGDLGALTGLANPDNFLSEAGRDTAEGFRSRQTPELQARRELAAREIEAADSFGGELAAAVATHLGSPSLLLDVVMETVPSLVGSVGTGAAVRVGVRGAQRLAGRRVTSAATEAAERIAQRAGVGGAVASNAVQQSASVGGETLQEALDMDMSLFEAMPDFGGLVDEGLASGLTEEQAREEAKQVLALSASRDAALGAFAVSLAAQSLPGARALEQSLLRAPANRAAANRFLSRIGSSGVGRFARGAAGEGFSEAIEEGGGEYFGGLARQTIDPTVDPLRGAGAAAGIGGLAGAAMGGPVNVIAGRRQPEAPTPDPSAADPADPAAPEPQLLTDGIPEPVAPTLPEGVEALTPQQASVFNTRAQRLVRRVNEHLKKEGIMYPEADGTPSTTPMVFTVADLIQTPDDVIGQAMATGMNSDELSAFRNELQAEAAEATQSRRIESIMDDSVRRSVRMMNEEELTRFAAEMGWSVDQVQAAARSRKTGAWDTAPEDLRSGVVNALARIREEARLRGEAEREAGFRAHAERLAETELAAVRAEAQSRAEADLRAASEAEEANLRITRQVLGRDPDLPPPQMPPPLVDRLREADAVAGQLEDTQALAVGAPRGPRFDPAQYAMDPPATGDPLVDAEILRAFNRGSAVDVREILQRHGASGRHGAPAARAALEAFNTRLEALTGGTPPFP